MFKWFRTIFSLGALTYYSPATAILNEIPWFTCLRKIKYWICSSRQTKKKSSTAFFFFAAALFSPRIAINVHVLQRFAWVVHQYIESPRDNQKPGAKTNPLKTNELNFSDYSLLPSILTELCGKRLEKYEDLKLLSGRRHSKWSVLFLLRNLGLSGLRFLFKSKQVHCRGGATLWSDTDRKLSWFYCQTKQRLVKQTSLTGFSPPTQSKHNKLLSL